MIISDLKCYKDKRNDLKMAATRVRTSSPFRTTRQLRTGKRRNTTSQLSTGKRRKGEEGRETKGEEGRETRAKGEMIEHGKLKFGIVASFSFYCDT